MTNKSDNTGNNDENVFGQGMIFLGVILILGLLLFWFFSGKLDQLYNPNQNVNSSINSDFAEVILQRNDYNHYVTSGAINGESVVLFLDTGASSVSIPERIAKELNLPKGRAYQTSTANGIIRVYSTVLDSISIGDITLRNVSASINPHYDQDILLGMSFLKHLDFAQKGDQLTLRQDLGSKKSGN